MSLSFTITLADPIITVRTAEGLHVNVDVSRIPDNVRTELFRQGCIKPLTDISADKSKEETVAMLHDRRLKRVENWYNGDFSVRGGGTADPVTQQMKEEIVSVYIKAGVKPADARKHVKGTALQFLEAQSKLQDGDEAAQAAWLTERVAHYRKLAEATLASRSKSAAKLDLSQLKI